MFPKTYPDLPESVTRRLLEAAQADRSLDSVSAHPEDLAHTPDDLFVTDWTMSPGPPTSSDLMRTPMPDAPGSASERAWHRTDDF